jgi:endonuclease III-like uncharacterized protein
VEEQVSAAVDLQRKMSEGASFQDQMQLDIKELKEFKSNSAKFYEKKASEIRQLSNRLSNYHPLDQLSQITQKVSLSAHTADLIRSRLMKTMA